MLPCLCSDHNSRLCFLKKRLIKPLRTPRIKYTHEEPSACMAGWLSGPPGPGLQSDDQKATDKMHWNTVLC